MRIYNIFADLNCLSYGNKKWEHRSSPRSLINDIKNFLPANIKITNVNTYSALETQKFLSDNDLLNFSKKMPEIFAYTTDNIDSFEAAAKKFCNITFRKTEKVVLA